MNDKNFLKRRETWEVGGLRTVGKFSAAKPHMEQGLSWPRILNPCVHVRLV